MSGWDVELLLARDARSRRALANDRIKGITRRVRQGVYVEESAMAGLTKEDKQVIAARALVAVSDRPIVFSHWTACVVHRVPTIGDLSRVHVTFTTAGARGLEGVSSHLLALLDEEVVELHGLLVTGVARTVVDVAGTGTIEEGVIAADGALVARLPKRLLRDAIDLAGPRKSARRIDTVVDFADAGGRSAAESSSRWTMHRMRIEVPVLQFRVHDDRGFVGDADFHFPEADALGEVDGLKKYLDPAFAPLGAGIKVYEEKRREDRLRACIARLARWSFAEGRDPRRLGPILARVGVLPLRRRLVL